MSPHDALAQPAITIEQRPGRAIVRIVRTDESFKLPLRDASAIYTQLARFSRDLQDARPASDRPDPREAEDFIRKGNQLAHACFENARGGRNDDFLDMVQAVEARLADIGSKTGYTCEIVTVTVEAPYLPWE